jgi:hypothetical protein
MADTERRAQELGTKLSKLSKDVKILSEDLGRDVDCLTNEVNIDVAIKTVEDHIKNVETKLNKLKSQVNVAPLLTSYYRAAGLTFLSVLPSQVTALLSVAATSLTIGGGLGWLAGARCACGILSMLGFRARDVCILRSDPSSHANPN